MFQDYKNHQVENHSNMYNQNQLDNLASHHYTNCSNQSKLLTNNVNTFTVVLENDYQYETENLPNEIT